MANYSPNTWTTGDTITKTKMDRLEAGAAAALPSADAPELIRDTIGTALVAGANVTITPNDGADTITIAATGGGSGGVPDDGSVTNAKVATGAAINADKLADGTTNKVLTATERTKLTGIATAATANSTDATLLARANHTGTQAASTITGLATVATSGSASDLGAGTVATARLGSGTASSSTYLRGDNTWATPSGGGSSSTTINVQTGTTYTFVLGDADTTIVRAGNAGAQTYTIPPNSSVAFPVGTALAVLRYGAGTLSLAQGAGVTLRPSSPQTARAQYSTITAIQVAANEWIVGGDVA